MFDGGGIGRSPHGQSHADALSTRPGQREPMTPRPTFTPRDVEEMADALLKLGYHPRVVRLRLAEKGVRWEYQFLGQGSGEKARRLRQRGLGLCSACRQESYVLGSAVNVCPSCLEAKWSETPTVRRIGHGAPDNG